MIFNVFKSRPKLKELIPKGFIDIHSHILPGIDDGAKNVKESIELISQMEKIGFSKIIGTPHTYPGLYENTRETIKKSYNSVISNLKNDTEIEYASEYMLNYSLIKKAEKKDLLTLKDNYVLIEMSLMFMDLSIYEIIFELQSHGYKIILAHPERYGFLIENFKEYYKLKKHGCYFQLNILSLVNYYGKKITNISNRLLKEGLIDFLGSDIHNIHQIEYFNQKVCVNELKILSKIFNKNYF